MKSLVASIFLLGFLLVSFGGNAQKGMGDSNGMAKTDQLPELVSLVGTVMEIKTGPCKLSTGKSNSGTHIIVQSENELFNIHLGPTNQVKEFVSSSKGQRIEVMAFRTEKLPEDHYIAQKIAYGGNELVLRDGYLKPFWANRNCRAIWK